MGREGKEGEGGREEMGRKREGRLLPGIVGRFVSFYTGNGKRGGMFQLIYNL